MNKTNYVEGLSINESLACLGRVIKNLKDFPNVKKTHHDLHMLTKILKDSFGGKAKTLALVNINPSMFNVT